MGPESESLDVSRADESENALVRIYSGLPGNAGGSESRCSAQLVRPNARTQNSYVKSADEMFGVEEEEAFNDAVEKGYFEGYEPETEEYNEAIARREAKGPYFNNLDHGQLRRNGKLVNDGGYRDGVLVDVDLEEEEYGAFTSEQLEFARRVANNLGVEPRILSRPAAVPAGDVQEEGGLTDKE